MKEKPLKEFAKYSDDELRQELIRRRIKKQIDFYKTDHWYFWEAVINDRKNTHSRYTSYRYEYKLTPIVGDLRVNTNLTYGVHDRKRFRLDTVPNVGDIVKLRCRILSNGEINFDRSKIIEVTKRSEL